ncbi:MAG: hypothetical protein PHE51_07535, partial [Eubacteriales bacterium]|nr:hypothetical protein [Eubacteriales bacterium]
MICEIGCKKLVIPILVILIIFSLNFYPSYAAAPSNNLVVSDTITKWVTSSDSSLIYAVASNTGQLFCINANTLTIAKMIKVSSNLQDICLYKGIIYISIPSAKQIVTIDEATLTIIDRYYTTADAYSIAVEDGKLFYATQKWVSYLYELNLATGIDKLTSAGRLSEPDIEIDPEKHILYIGESGSSGSDFIAISTLDYS